MYELWRDGILPGRFAERSPVMHHGRRLGALGILEPTDAFAGVSPVMQTRSQIAPGRPVFQHPVEPLSLGAPRPAKPSKQNWSALQPLSEQEARGVPREKILEIRADDGALIDADFLELNLFAVPEGIDPSEIHESNGLAGNSREIWHVFFAVSPSDPNDSPP